MQDLRILLDIASKFPQITLCQNYIFKYSAAFVVLGVQLEGVSTYSTVLYSVNQST